MSDGVRSAFFASILKSHGLKPWECVKDGKIRPKNKLKPRGKRKFADYLLLYNGDFLLAVVEAKRKLKTPDEGIDQAKEYAQILGVKFAYTPRSVIRFMVQVMEPQLGKTIFDRLAVRWLLGGGLRISEKTV